MPVRVVSRTNHEVAVELAKWRSLRQRNEISKAYYNRKKAYLQGIITTEMAAVIKARVAALMASEKEKREALNTKRRDASALKKRNVYCAKMLEWVAIIGDGAEHWRPHFQEVNQFFKGVWSGRVTSIEIFLKAKDAGAVKYYTQVPSWMAPLFQYRQRLEHGGTGYNVVAPLLIQSNETYLGNALGNPVYPPAFIILYNHGEMPEDTGVEMADEEVEDGWELVPPSPFIDPSLVKRSKSKDCLPRAIVEHLKASWDGDKALGKNPLTIETILNCVERTTTKLSLRQCEPFFAKYRIKVRATDLQGKDVYNYEPVTRNKHITCRIRLLQHNGHVTSLNRNLKSWDQQERNKEFKASSEYFDKQVSGLQANNLEELSRIFDTKEKAVVYFKGTFEQVWEFGKQRGMEGKIGLSKGYEAKSLSYYHTKTDKLTVRFSECSMKTMEKMREALFHGERYKSRYSASVRKVFNDLKRGQLVASFSESYGFHTKIDRCRSYTANFRDIDAFPVFNYSELTEFDGVVKDTMIYLVGGCEDTEGWIIANQRHNIVSGLVILRSGLQFNIVGQIRPSSWEPNTIRDTLKEMYKDLGNEDLKLVANMGYGLAAMLTSTKIEGTYTTSVVEAHALSKKVKLKGWMGLEGYVAITQEDKSELVNGYYGVAFMILDFQRLRMLEMYRDLTSKGFSVHGISTDCLYVTENDASCWDRLQLHKGVKTWDDDLGKYRLDDYGALPKISYRIKEARTEADIHPIAVFKSVEKIEGNTFVSGSIPGSGKSFTQIQYCRALETDEVRETDVLIVCPSRARVSDVKAKSRNCDVITYADFLGRIYDDDGAISSRKTKHSMATYKKVILEELMMLVPLDLLEVLERCKAFPEIQVLGNGDMDQNKMGELPNSFSSYSAFYEAVLPTLFPNMLTLKGSMRLEGPNRDADEAALIGMKADLKAGLSHIGLVRKYQLNTFADKTFANGKTSISFTNLAAMVRPSGVTSLKFKGYDPKKVLVKNTVYECERGSVNGKGAILIAGVAYNPCDFGNPEATTGHSSQGDTLKTPFCIFEWNHFHATWEWFHTAIARCQRLSDVWIYVGPSTTSKVERDILAKLKGHSDNDKKEGRTWAEGEYVDTKWVREALKKCNATCPRCHFQMELEYEPGSLRAWTINRLNNALSHVKQNCELCCRSCNHGYRHIQK